MDTSKVLVATIDKTVWIKVIGRGSFQNSGGIKSFVRHMMDQGVREFVMDLENCEMKDSTFMGTLAGISLRLKELGQGNLRTVHTNRRNRELLENLGLDRIIDVEAHRAEDAPHIETMTESSLEGTDPAHQTILSAHKALVEVNPENAARFQDLLEVLQSEETQSSGDGKA